MKVMGAVAFVALLLGVGESYGDGLPMKYGRYAGGPVTIMGLTDEQMVTAKTARIVVLTARQKERLKRDAGQGPTVLHVLSLQTAGKDCTCLALNIAVWFSARQIEVPHAYVKSDDDAAAQIDAQEAEYDQDR